MLKYMFSISNMKLKKKQTRLIVDKQFIIGYRAKFIIIYYRRLVLDKPGRLLEAKGKS